MWAHYRCMLALATALAATEASSNCVPDELERRLERALEARDDAFLMERIDDAEADVEIQRYIERLHRLLNEIPIGCLDDPRVNEVGAHGRRLLAPALTIPSFENRGRLNR